MGIDRIERVIRKRIDEVQERKSKSVSEEMLIQGELSGLGFALGVVEMTKIMEDKK